MSEISPRREPMFNVPPVVLATLALLVAIHLVRAYGLTPAQDLDFLVRFAFIPARYDPALASTAPGGVGAWIWTFFTYALIHGDVTHLGVNAVWLLAFGSAVARRFGALRFVLFALVTAAAGALVYLLTHQGEIYPMVGASAAISGFMAAAMRFMFQSGRTVFANRMYRAPAAPLSVVLRDPRALAFLGAWFAINLIFGLGAISIGEAEQSIAWQAHIGGFLAGLLLFRWFDPVPRRTALSSDADPRTAPR